MSEAHDRSVADNRLIHDAVAPAGGPRRTTSLRSRRSPLASARNQIATLDAVNLRHVPHGGDFDAALAATGAGKVTARDLEFFQINLGKLCNMTCRHCHVDVGWYAIAGACTPCSG